MLALPKRPPDKQAKDLLHDTFAIFTDSLVTVKTAWDALGTTMLAAHVRTFEVSDLVRRAARIASDRAAPPTPDLLLLGLRR